MNTIKPPVKIFQDLPLDGNTVNDKRLVLFTKTTYQWDGSTWQEYVNPNCKLKNIFTIRMPT